MVTAYSFRTDLGTLNPDVLDMAMIGNYRAFRHVVWSYFVFTSSDCYWLNKSRHLFRPIAIYTYISKWRSKHKSKGFIAREVPQYGLARYSSVIKWDNNKTWESYGHARSKLWPSLTILFDELFRTILFTDEKRSVGDIRALGSIPPTVIKL